MQTEKQDFDTDRPSRTLHYSDPLVIGAGALVLGFALGSGRLNWFSREAGKIAGSLGDLALRYLLNSLQEHNPELFTSKSRMTH